MWSYKCVNNRCIRQHYIEADDAESSFGGSTPGKRVPFLTCTMTCGPINIWPQPTGKTTIGSKASRFRLGDIHAHMTTGSEEVESLLNRAFDVFRDELHSVLVAHGETYDDTDELAATEGSEVNRGKESDGEKPEQPLKIRFYRPADENRYDVDKFDVKISVLKSSETYLTLHTDESYNLSVTRKYRCEHIIGSILIGICPYRYSTNSSGENIRQQLLWGETCTHYAATVDLVRRRGAYPESSQQSLN